MKRALTVFALAASTLVAVLLGVTVLDVIEKEQLQQARRKEEKEQAGGVEFSKAQ